MGEPSASPRVPVPYRFWNLGNTNGFINSMLLEKVADSFPICPRLVVTTIAPLAALLPYIAAAAAPVRKEMLSISSGLISAMASVAPLESNSVPPPPPKLYIGIPSMTYSALLLCSIDFVPRITTLLAPPTPEEEALMTTPAAFPLKLLIKLASFISGILSAPICWTL